MANATHQLLMAIGGGDPPGEGIQMEGFQGIGIFNEPLPDQIDISLEGFQGLAIAQITYP